MAVFGPRAVECVSNNASVPEFEPHPLIRSAHAQTIIARFLPGKVRSLPSRYAELEAGDGDRLSVLESTPEGWSPGAPLVLMVHGLAGCARSPYVVRIGARLFAMGVRVVRMNLRGTGSGFGSARGIYHAGRTEDLRLVAEWMVRRAQGSPLALLGFSLGGNLVLKLAAEAADTPLEALSAVVAANPPIDLAACCRKIQREENRIYDRNFVKTLRAEVNRLHDFFPDLGLPQLPEALSLFEFDDLYTAPRNGFSGAADYYARSSVAPLIPRISVPGLVVHASDDPFIAVESFHAVEFPSRLALELIPNGGHLGYLSRAPWMGDHRWLDARLSTWLAIHWNRR